ncbi:MAG: MEDS domain-containing protein [Nocardiopsaceae bacterium]|nr:MEDS domain-containing protein [Nocardiopsaceae bacterium]
MAEPIVSGMGIDDVRLLPGSHVCAFYRGDSDRDRLLNGYFGAGLSAGDKCVCVVDSRNTAERLRALPQSCPGHALDDDQLDVHLPETTYLAGGTFTTGDMLTFWTDNMLRATADGYTFCRLAGEMTWALRDAPGVEHLIGYESELNRFTAGSPVVVLCLYDLDRFSGEVVVNVVMTHPQVLVQGILIENPYYVGPDEFARLARPDRPAQRPPSPDAADALALVNSVSAAHPRLP